MKITNAFQEILDENLHINQIKIWEDKGSEFYNRSMKSWLQDNNIEMYSIHNEGKSVVAEKIIRELKTKIYKHMISISKNLYTVMIRLSNQHFSQISAHVISSMFNKRPALIKRPPYKGGCLIGDCLI